MLVDSNREINTRLVADTRKGQIIFPAYQVVLPV